MLYMSRILSSIQHRSTFPNRLSSFHLYSANASKYNLSILKMSTSSHPFSPPHHPNIPTYRTSLTSSFLTIANPIQNHVQPNPLRHRNPIHPLHGQKSPYPNRSPPSNKNTSSSTTTRRTYHNHHPQAQSPLPILENQSRLVPRPPRRRRLPRQLLATLPPRAVGRARPQWPRPSAPRHRQRLQ